MSNIVLHEKYEKEKRSENMQEKALLKRYKSFFIHTKLKCDFDQILQLLIISILSLFERHIYAVILILYIELIQLVFIFYQKQFSYY